MKTSVSREDYMQLTLATFNALGQVTDLDQHPLKRLVEKYFEHFVSDGTSTLRCKSGDFKELLLFLGKGDINRPTLADFTKRNVENFREYRIEQGEAFSTVNRRLATFKHFSRVLQERVHTYHDDIKHVGIFELPAPVSKALTDEEKARIRALPTMGSTEFASYRNRAIIELLLATGLRAEELLSINIGHMDGRWLRQLKTKGRQIRNVYMVTAIDSIIASYLNLRTEELNRRCPGHMYLTESEKNRFPLWVTFYGANINDPASFRMSYETLRTTIYRIGEAAGVENLHAHRFRHDMLTELRRAGNDLATMQRAAGHKDIRQTQRYYVATDEEVVAAQEGRFAGRFKG
jgi:site-specific recombinase XerD